MPKRPNPFGDSSPLQFKTYVTKKEVDTGVCRDTNMKLVYEKTKSLLYEGSRKLNRENMGLVPCLTSLQDLSSASGSGPEIPQLPGQLTLNNNGCLSDVIAPSSYQHASSFNIHELPDRGRQEQVMDGLSSHSGVEQMNAFSVMMNAVAQTDTHPSGPSHKPLQSGPTGVIVCQSCNRSGVVCIKKCGFCERGTCSNCVRSCHSCSGSFCYLCSILDFSDDMEAACCLQCHT